MGPWLSLERVGEGATAIVWRARHRVLGQLAAPRAARESEPAVDALAREGMLLARVERRWGPALLDAGPGFVATEWLEGRSLEPAAITEGLEGREHLAAVIAHAVGRALAELHQAGVRHGDVKPQNVLRSSLSAPGRDAPEDRAATLIDLGLASGVQGRALGGTPRYAAPELRERGEASTAADLWALGVVLAEILDPGVAAAAEPRAAIAAGWGGSGGEPERWARALLVAAPGGRPSASWVAGRAVRWLGLREDDQVAALARIDRVRRTYLAERMRDVGGHALVSDAIDGPARAWLDSALGWAQRLSGPVARVHGRIEALGAVRRARWLVSLVGPSAASWPIAGDGRSEGDLVAHALELAIARDPSSWTLEDIRSGKATGPKTAWPSAQGEDRVARLSREMARPAPNAEAIAIAEDDAVAGRAPPTLAIQLAAALLRAGESGRAGAVLDGVGGGEVDGWRAEISRRRGDIADAEVAARRAVSSGDEASRCRGQGDALKRLSNT